MPLALPAPEGDAVLFTPASLAPLLASSQHSPRKRMIQPVQRTENSLVQRLLNAMQCGTYIRPHCHPGDQASETVVLLQGRLGLLIYDHEGKVTAQYDLTPGCLIDIEPNTWHGMVCLSENTVIAEFKKGPYDAKTDKEFAPWAPEEHSTAAPHYVQELEQLFH